MHRQQQLAWIRITGTSNLCIHVGFAAAAISPWWWTNGAFMWMLMCSSQHARTSLSRLMSEGRILVSVVCSALSYHRQLRFRAFIIRRCSITRLDLLLNQSLWPAQLVWQETCYLPSGSPPTRNLILHACWKSCIHFYLSWSLSRLLCSVFCSFWLTRTSKITGVVDKTILLCFDCQ